MTSRSRRRQQGEHHSRQGESAPPRAHAEVSPASSDSSAVMGITSRAGAAPVPEPMAANCSTRSARLTSRGGAGFERDPSMLTGRFNERDRGAATVGVPRELWCRA